MIYLPPEIWVNIFHHLDAFDIVNLQFVNRAFKNIVKYHFDNNIEEYKEKLENDKQFLEMQTRETTFRQLEGLYKELRDVEERIIQRNIGKLYVVWIMYIILFTINIIFMFIYISNNSLSYIVHLIFMLIIIISSIIVSFYVLHPRYKRYKLRKKINRLNARLN